MNVTVKFANGSARSFDSSVASKDVVRSIAVNQFNVADLPVRTQFELLDTLETLYHGEADNSVLTSDALSAAGIESVTVGNPPAQSAPVKAGELQAEDDDIEYAATVDAQERPGNSNLTPEASKYLATLESRSVKSTPVDFKPGKTNTVAPYILTAALALATFSAGVLTGGTFF